MPFTKERFDIDLFAQTNDRLHHQPEEFMNLLRRILVGLILLLGAAGLLLSLAGAISIWIIKKPVTDRAAHVFERVGAALDIADKALGQVKTSLSRAAERLESVREEQRKIAAQPRRLNPVKRMLSRTVQRKVAPEVSNAHEKLHTVAEAAVVVNSVLEDVGNLPFLSAAGLDLSQISQLNSQLTTVEASAWELSRLFADQGSKADADTASRQLSRIDRALKTMQGWIADFEPRLIDVRKRAEQLQSKTLTWIPPATILISVVCFWIALLHVSLLCHAWSWWRR
jgi:hypothetical protein